MCKNKALREELKPLESHFFSLLGHVVSITGARTLRKTGLAGGSFPLISLHAIPLRELLQGLQQKNVLLKAILMKFQD